MILKVNSQHYPGKTCRLPSRVFQRNFQESRWFVGIFGSIHFDPSNTLTELPEKSTWWRHIFQKKRSTGGQVHLGGVGESAGYLP